MDLRQTVGTLHFAACAGDKNMLKKLIEDLPFQEIEKKDCLGQTPLLCSIAYNHLECASVLLKAGARVDSSDNTGQTALHIGINKGLYHCVKFLLSHGAVWCQTDLEGISALHTAAVAGSPKCLSVILNKLKPGEIDIQDGFQKTALHWSSAYGYIEHVRMLLSKDANICIPDKEGKTPVHWAATNPNALECLKILIQKVPNAVNWQDYTGRTALHLSVLSGSLQMVDLLTSKRNCDIDILDNLFCTPLHLAAKEGLQDKITLLLDRGASYKCVDCNGATPLHYAALNNHPGAVELFLLHSYIQDMPDFLGRNALIWAAGGSANDVIEIMAEYHVDFSFRDKSGSTALHVAAVQSDMSTVELLLTCGAPVNAVDNNGITPLLKACGTGRVKIVDYLLNNEASPLSIDYNGRNCLHWASKGGHAYLCQILLQKSMQFLNAEDSCGMTPLHYASSKGYINCVSVFLEAGANPNVTDSNGWTSLHWSSLNDHIDVVKLLYEYDAFTNAMASHYNDKCNVIASSKRWITPLDCATHNQNIQIVNFLQLVGGLTAFDVELIAVKKIQSWFREIHRSRKHASDCKKRKIVKHENLKFNENVHLNHHHQSDPSFNHKLSFIPQENLKHIKTSIKNVSKIPTNEKSNENRRNLKKAVSLPCTFSDSDFNFKNNYFVTDYKIKELAARTIQKAWKRFHLKKGICFMKERIATAFPTKEHREAAEKAWTEQLQNFLGSL